MYRNQVGVNWVQGISMSSCNTMCFICARGSYSGLFNATIALSEEGAVLMQLQLHR